MARARRPSPELKALVFLAVFLFSLGASAHAAVTVPELDLTRAGVGTALVFGIAAPALWRLATRRLRRLPSIER